MSGALAAVLSLLLAQAGPAAGSTANEAIVLGEKKPIGFLLITPTGNVASTSSSELIRIVSAQLTEHTDLRAAIIEPAAVAECRGRVACFASKSGSEARLLLVLSNLTGSGADRLTVLLIDTDAARRIADETPRDTEDFDLELEARINDGAVLARPKWVALANEGETRNYLRRLFESELKAGFERTGNWEPYGSIELIVEHEAMGIELDGAAIGTTRPGRTTILHVTPGKRSLRLTHPSFEPYSGEANVERGSTVQLTPELVAEAGLAPALRTGMFWTGLGLAATGTALTAIAVARQSSSVKSYCIEGVDPGCSAGRSFQRADYDPDRAPTFEDDVNPGGLLLAPAGYSLIAAGGSWALLSALFEGDTRAPWIELAAGLAIGGLSYGLSAAFE